MVKVSALPVERVMSRSFHCIGLEESLPRAVGIMRFYGIRHLPVLENGRPVGMLSERDIVLAETLSERGISRVTIAEAMTSIPYCVSPDTSVAEVASHLARRKLDSALVVSGAQVLGVFTSTDAFALLAEDLTDPDVEQHDEELPPLTRAVGH